MLINIPSLPFYQKHANPFLIQHIKLARGVKNQPEIKTLPLVTDDYSFRKTKQKNLAILYGHLFIKTPFDYLIIILFPFCYGGAQLCLASVIDSSISPMCC